MARWLLVLYVAAALAIGFWPAPVDRPVDGVLGRVIAAAHRHGQYWFTYRLVEFAANIALFVPLGLLTGLLLGRRWFWAGAIIGVLGSGVIEIGQAMFRPARFATLDDVLANSLGAALGAGLAGLLLWAARPGWHRRPPAAVNPHRPLGPSL